MRKSRFLAALMVLCLLVGMIPMAATATENPFTDVSESKYYYEPVMWAVSCGITTGKTATEFQPNGECTRAQVVTFLWRANGQPEPLMSINPFTDVKETAYYYKAVLWAVEKGITTGKTATTFEPSAHCTRSQVVTFLWRWAGKPAPAVGENKFTDVKDSAYYYNAVLWAVEKGITTGKTATEFQPTATCTRGQIVTFLHRNEESNHNQTPGQAEEVTLRVWVPETAFENDFIVKAAEAFQRENPQWELTVQFETCHPSDAGNFVTADPMAAADVYAFSNDLLPRLLEAKALAPLEGKVLEQVQKNNSETILSMVSQDGKVYAVPYNANTWFMYYDKSVFSQEDIKSLDTMMEKGTVGFPIDNSWYLPAFYFAAGGTMFGDGTDSSAGIRFGSERCAGATAYIARALESGKLVNDMNGVSGMKSRNVDATFSGAWDLPNAEQELGENLGIAPVPCITLDGEQVQMRAFLGAFAYGVNAYSKHPEVAAAFAAWLGSNEMQLMYYELSQKYMVPVSSTILETAPVLKNDQLVAAVNQTVNDAAAMQPIVPEMMYYWDPARIMASWLISGEINDSNALERTQSWNEALNKN